MMVSALGEDGQRWYDFLGVRLRVSSNSPEFMKVVHIEYQCFEVPSPAGLTPDVDARFIHSGLKLLVNGRRLDPPCIEDPHDEALWIIRKEVARHLQDYFLIHGAVVVREGKGVVISGPPKAGKTTLSLALTGKGWILMSDDVAPVHGQSGMIHPFPRAIHVRARPPFWVGRETTAGGGWRETIPFPIHAEKLSPAPWSALVLLANSNVTDLLPFVMDVVVQDPADLFFDQVLRIEGVSGEVVLRKGGCGRYLISVERGADAIKAFRETKNKWRDRIIRTIRLDHDQYDFDRHPSIDYLPTSRACMLAARELMEQGDPGALPNAGLLANLASILSDVQVMSMKVGYLDEMVKLLEEHISI
jgi:hypothetical protein